MKKAIKKTLILFIAAALIAGGSFACLADEVDYGSFDNGYYTTDNSISGWNYFKYPYRQSFDNGDFEQGYKYWTSSSQNKQTSKPYHAEELFKLEEENGNHYVVSNTNGDYQNISSAPFKLENVTPGQELVPIYDWRGSSAFQIVLQQWTMNADLKGGTENRIAFSNNQIIKEAASDDEWTTQFSYNHNPRKDGTSGVIKPEEGKDPGLYFTLRVEAVSASTDIQIDNIKLGIYRRNEKKIYSLDGKTVLYDFDAIEEESVQEEVEEDEPYFDINEEENKDTKGGNNVNKNTKDNGLGWLLYVIIGAGVAVVAAAAVVITLVVKKKKTNSAEPKSDDKELTTELKDSESENKE